MIRRLLPALCACILLSLPAALMAAGEEGLYVYRSIYRMADSLQGKYAAILSMSSSDDTAAAPALAEALDDLLRLQSNYSSPGEKELHARAVSMALSRLGAWKYEAAAPSAWNAFSSVGTTSFFVLTRRPMAPCASASLTKSGKYTSGLPSICSFAALPTCPRREAEYSFL